MKNFLEGQDVLSAEQFSEEEILYICEIASHMETELQKGKNLRNLNNKILATLFFEPSTRTRLSFEAAMLRAGGQVISVAEGRSSSAAKGESIADAVRVVEHYADVIVMRHPKVGAAQEAAAAAGVPVINGGDGTGQHPTQSLLDAYTMLKEKGTIDGLTVCMLGDLKNGRTVHSLSRLLSLFDVRLFFVSPDSLRMPGEILEALEAKGIRYTVTSDLDAALKDSDILYVTRIQKERFDSEDEYLKVKGSYTVNAQLLKGAKKGITIMHPLPRVDEIDPDVDSHPGAAYFRQAANGIPVRIALLAMVCGRL